MAIPRLYELSPEDLRELLDVAQSVVVPVPGLQEHVNQVWERLGEKMGFDWRTARPLWNEHGRFMAEPFRKGETDGAQ